MIRVRSAEARGPRHRVPDEAIRRVLDSDRVHGWRMRLAEAMFVVDRVREARSWRGTVFAIAIRRRARAVRALRAYAPAIPLPYVDRSADAVLRRAVRRRHRARLELINATNDVDRAMRAQKQRERAMRAEQLPPVKVDS